MTLTPDRTIDDLDFPTPLVHHVDGDSANNTDENLILDATNGAILQRIEPAPRPTMAQWQAAMDEMESNYVEYQQQQEQPSVTVDMIYEAVREVNAQEAMRRQQRQMMMEAQRRATFANHYCYCSPGRGMFFERWGEARMEQFVSPEPVTCHTWTPEPAPVMSKELAVIQSAPNPLIPEPEPEPEPVNSFMPILAGIGCSVMAGFIGCLIFALCAL